ncbi:MAG: cytochrome c3 family protein [Bacillota bacterium]|nr:cytochrome c3 family protein [Bacillota bacterium]
MKKCAASAVATEQGKLSRERARTPAAPRRPAAVRGVRARSGPALLALLLAAAAWLLPSPAAGAASIVGSKHDLSLSGPGPVKAQTETQICIFCHTPHNAQPEKPLWSHLFTAQTYTPYSSSTMQGAPGQPTGSSKLCLSCHDGTVAIGAVVEGTIAMLGTAADGTMPAGTSDLGLNLGDDHPVSFVPNLADAEIRTPPAGDPVRLDASGQVQCTSCHDPHDPQYGAVAGGPGKFLVKANDDGTYGSQLCLACHPKTGWTGSAHQAATNKYYNGRLGNAKVSQYACESCHRPHSATEPARLLEDNNASATVEEAVCFRCHNGTVATRNVQSDFAKTTQAYTPTHDWDKLTHPVGNYSGVHSPTEAAVRPPAHIECVDCHNPHQAKVDSPTRPNLWGSMAGVRGVDVNYGASTWETTPDPVPRDAPSVYEFNVCFRCHAGGATSDYPYLNVSRQFNPNNPSYHVIAGITSVSKTNYGIYVKPWTKTSALYCTDCHGAEVSDPRTQPPNTGPHGSVNPGILIAPWNANTGKAGLDTSKHLCFKCHDYNFYTGQTLQSRPPGYSTNGTQTAFSSGGFATNLHQQKHGGSKAPGCMACHSRIPHGAFATDGGNDSRNNLISATFEGRSLLARDDDSFQPGDWRIPYSSRYLRVKTWPTQGNWSEGNCDHGTGCG